MAPSPQPSVQNASPGAIERAAGILRAGGTVAFPTETVYGLGADATNEQAVRSVFEAKDRPPVNPLIVHAPGLDQIAALAEMNDPAQRLARAFWPGSLTLVLPRLASCPISPLVSAGLATLAVRVPDHPVALELLRATGRPLAAPSANPSGRISPTTAQHVAEGLGAKVSLILDGGPCPLGLESTIVLVAADSLRLLRPGAIGAEEIAEAAGIPLEEAEAAPEAAPDRPLAPGQMARHYAPGAPLRLNARQARPGEAALGFGQNVPAGAVQTLNLSPTGDLAEAAANLYAMLHALDDPAHTGIAVAEIPDQGLGRAINDRLRRGAQS